MTFMCAQHLFRAGKGGCLHACGEASLFQLWLRRGFLGWCSHGLGRGCLASQHPCMTPRRHDGLPGGQICLLLVISAVMEPKRPLDR